MTYDETWDDRPARRQPLPAIAVVVALAALAASMFVLARQASVLSTLRVHRKISWTMKEDKQEGE